jgi:hypothetical protein
MTINADVMRNVLFDLAKRKPVFCSEMDFQLHLAWEMKERGFDLSLEFDPQCFDANAAIDILIHAPDRVAIELKYKTARLNCEVHGQPLRLKNQAAQDIARHDLFKDVWRLERVVGAGHAKRGFAIFLTNDGGYWRKGRNGTADERFRIFEGRSVSGGTHGWGPNTSKGTMRGREQAISVTHDYVFGWTDFAKVTGKNGEFRYLLVEVEASGRAGHLRVPA